MYAFALRGRWILGLLAVLLAAAVCVRLGIWQLDRRDERLSYNATVERRGDAPVEPLDTLLATGAPASIEYRPVVARGTFDGDRELMVRARSFNGAPGMHVVTPLVLDDGRAVLVNRGFVPVTDPDAAVPPQAKPPGGEVEVVGVLRASESDGRFDAAHPDVAAAGTLGHITRIDVDRLAGEYPFDLVPVSVRVEQERPEAAGIPIPLAPPDLGQGPHLSYAIQWFSFAIVFLVGWAVLVWRHAHREQGPPAVSGNGHVSLPSAEELRAPSG